MKRSSIKRSKKHHADQKPRGKMRRRVVTAMEIPADLAQRAALVELTGQESLRVENYLGILEYSGEKLLLQCKTCRLEIIGTALRIQSYTREELLLCGHIDQVHYF